MRSIRRFVAVAALAGFVAPLAQAGDSATEAATSCKAEAAARYAQGDQLARVKLKGIYGNSAVRKVRVQILPAGSTGFLAICEVNGRSGDIVSIEPGKDFVALLPHTKKNNAEMAVWRVWKHVKSVEELRSIYGPDLQGLEIVPVHIITDAHTLKAVPDASQDFVVANQVLEHLENPLLALENILRVLKPGAVAFLSLPDHRFTFDSDRPVTPFSHLLDDYRLGPELSREGHYREWATLVEKTPPAELDDRVDLLMNRLRYAIHFHVWTQYGMFQLFDQARAVLPRPYEIECFKANGDEAIAILRRS